MNAPSPAAIDAASRVLLAAAFRLGVLTPPTESRVKR